jgi:hypothetical protein
MKKTLLCLAAVAMTALVFTSCGKKCNCTRFEDGQKVVSYIDDETRYFETSACTEQSVDKYQGYSIVTDGKEVEIEIQCK